MLLFWTPRISRELATIIITISKENITAAEKFQERVTSLVTVKLKNQPFMGKSGRVEGTRELIITSNYILVYKLDNKKIVLVSLRHVAQEWPGGF